MFSPACVLKVPAYLGPSPFFIGAIIAFFLVLFRSRLIWDSPAFSFVCSFSLSCFSFVSIPAYLGLAPLDFVLWLKRSSLSFSEMHYLSVFGAPVAISCYRCIKITHGVPLMFSPACVL